MVLIGAHVRGDDPVATAAELDAGCVQLFLADPQGWKKPVPRADADALVASGLGIYAHAPYLVNVASTNNRIRIPSRNMIAQHAAAAAGLGARALIVHGGHVGDGDDIAVGIENWRKTFERATFPVKILVENTAGGENACARTLDGLALLWDAIGGYDVGLCLDTCHAWAAGEDLETVVERVRGHHGAGRPGARQQLARRAGLRTRPARGLRVGHHPARADRARGPGGRLRRGRRDAGGEPGAGHRVPAGGPGRLRTRGRVATDSG